MRCEHISVSRIMTYEACPYRYKMWYEDRLGSPVDYAKGLGHIFHAAQEAYRRPGANLTPEQAWAVACQVSECPNLDAFRDARAMFMMEAGNNPPGAEEVLGVEVELEAHLSSGLKAVGVIDLVSRMGPGYIMIKDYKTGNVLPPRDELLEAHQTMMYPFLSMVGGRFGRLKRVVVRYMYIRMSRNVDIEVDLDALYDYGEYADHVGALVLTDTQPGRRVNKYCWNCFGRGGCQPYLNYVNVLSSAAGSEDWAAKAINGDVDAMMDVYERLAACKSSAEKERETVKEWIVQMATGCGGVIRAKSSKVKLIRKKTRRCPGGVIADLAVKHGVVDKVLEKVPLDALEEALKGNAAAMAELEASVVEEKGTPFPMVSRINKTEKRNKEICESLGF
jgi:RecB family exonuclease